MRICGDVHQGCTSEVTCTGQLIGYVGESGEATGLYLHFEIRVNGIAWNPLTVKLLAGQSPTVPE